MVRSQALLTDETLFCPDGAILVQSVPKDKQIVIVDAYDNKHKIERYVIMTEDTMDAILDLFRNPDVQEFIQKHMPAGVPGIVVREC